MEYRSQKGAVHTLSLMLIVAAVGIISFLLISSTAPFKNGLFSNLFPKQSSHAATSATYFRLFSGYTDLIPRQIIRTSSDKLYVFAAQAQYSSNLKVYATNSTGMPNANTDFAFSSQLTEPAVIISVDTSYDGANTIHVLVNLQNGTLIDHPFDVTTNTFKPAKTIATGNPTVSGDYIGTQGVSSMVNKTGQLQIAYWSSGNHITNVAYTYDSAADTLTQTSAPSQVDTSGSANHPSVAISPVDNSLTVGWVSQATTPAQILVRTRDASGTWSAVQQASTGNVWVSNNAGINIDQGPSIVIDSTNTKHLVYIENFGSCGTDYGRAHYVSNSGSGWTDNTVSTFCTHAPSLAIDNTNQLYILGHGHPSNATCKSMLDICTVTKNPDGSWSNPVVFATHPGTDSFDASPSVKWGVVGWNSPDVVEFLFFSANGGNYNTTDIWYGRLASNSNPTPTPNPSPTGTTTVTTTFQISAGGNDGHDIAGNTTFNTGTPVKTGGKDVNGNLITAGFRFVNVTIPKGATINSATIDWQESWSGNYGPSVKTSIYGEASDNSSLFSSTSLPRSRVKTTSLANYNSASEVINAGTWMSATTANKPPSITPVLQEIVNRPGWVSGNALTVLVADAGTTNDWWWEFRSYEAGATNAPKLTVTYTTAGGTPVPTPTSTPLPTPTAPPTPTPTPSPTPTPLPTATPQPTPTPPPTGSITLQINSSSDDANQVTSTLTLTDANMWLGTGGSSTSSFAGLRFNGIAIPRGSVITSAKLQVNSVQSQWITMGLNYGAEAIGNSPTFSSSNAIAQRTLTNQRVNSTTNTQWLANTWYTMDEIAPVIQEVVNRTDWNPGNSLSLIIKGTNGTSGRKFIKSFNSSAAFAPKLIITYQ